VKESNCLILLHSQQPACAALGKAEGGTLIQEREPRQQVTQHISFHIDIAICCMVNSFSEGAFLEEEHSDGPPFSNY
jgi:hypothetical protein